MKVKTINAVISKKMREWWNSIEDEELRKLVEQNTIVTGGCIASMLSREKISDFDVYFKNIETVRRISEYYVNKFKETRKSQGIDTPIYIEELPCIQDPEFTRVRIVVKSAGIAGQDDPEYSYFEGRPPEEAGAYVGEILTEQDEIEDAYQEAESEALENEAEGYKPIFISTNAITLSKKIQIIIRFYGPPEEIHKNYDFIHCTNYWTKSTGVVLNLPAVESLITKELRYVGSRYPICSMIRTRKFIQRQWTINAGQFVKMAFQISKLDLEDLRVLEDQLTGVDVAYFHEVIGLLKEKDEKRVDSAYLVEILDRMF